MRTMFKQSWTLRLVIFWIYGIHHANFALVFHRHGFNEAKVLLGNKLQFFCFYICTVLVLAEMSQFYTHQPSLKSWFHVCQLYCVLVQLESLRFTVVTASRCRIGIHYFIIPLQTMETRFTVLKKPFILCKSQQATK